MPKVPRHLRGCTFCATTATESVTSAIVCLIALSFKAFGSSMQRFSGILMRSVMWHKDQKSVCALVLAIVNAMGRAQTL